MVLMLKCTTFIHINEWLFEVAFRLCSTPRCRTYRRKSPHTKAQRGGTSAAQPFAETKKKAAVLRLNERKNIK